MYGCRRLCTGAVRRGSGDALTQLLHPTPYFGRGRVHDHRGGAPVPQAGVGVSLIEAAGAVPTVRTERPESISAYCGFRSGAGCSN